MTLGSFSSSYRFWKWAVIGTAFFLAAAGLHYGLPYRYHQDEPMMVNHAMAIGVSGWNTHFFVIPPFVPYLLFMIYGVLFILGKAVGIFPDKAAFATAFLSDPTIFYFLGRFFIAALPSTGTVWLLFKMAKFYSVRAALWAALFLGLSLIHVQHAHYIYADALLTFALTLLCLRHLYLLRNPSWPNFICTGLVLGWATSIKYTALYFLPVAILGYAMAFGPRFFSKEALCKIGVSGVISFAVFAFLAPYTFLDWASFWATIGRQSGAQSFVGWGHYFFYSILNGSSWLWVALFAWGAWITRRFRETVFILTLIFTWYLINTFFGQAFSRYVLPLIPWMSILAGVGAAVLSDKLACRPRMRNFFFFVIILSLLAPSVYLDCLFFQKDTRTRCLEWVQANVPSDAALAIDNRFFGPPVTQNKKQIAEKMTELTGNGLDVARAARLEYELRVARKKKSYRIYTLHPGGTEAVKDFLFLKPALRPDWEELRRANVEYLIFNYTEIVPEAHKLLRAEGSRLEMAASFSPYWEKERKIPHDPFASTAAPHKPLELFFRKCLGPYIEVYRVKN